MSASRTFSRGTAGRHRGRAALLATAVRVLTQLRHDPRTIALLLGVPCLLMGMLRWLLDERPGQLDALGAPLLALFPFITMFLVTSVTMLRERIGGTLERLLTTPISKLDLLLGYWLAFAVVAGLQVSLVSALSLGPLDVDVAGPVWVVVVVAVIDALLGVALGLLVSAYARTEFQAIQFLPAIVFPQLLLCGLLVPRPELPDALRVVSDLFPLSYAMDAMISLAASSELTAELRADVAVTAGAALVALALAAGTLRRRSA